jgi:hypothetical protein
MTVLAEHISMDLLNQLRNKAKQFESFCLSPGESNNTSYTAQLLIIIQGITDPFRWSRNLLVLSLHNNRRIVFECMWNHERTSAAPDKTK